MSRFVKQQPRIMKMKAFDQNVPEFVGRRLKDSGFCCFVSRRRREPQDERVKSLCLDLFEFHLVLVRHVYDETLRT